MGKLEAIKAYEDNLAAMVKDTANLRLQQKDILLRATIDFYERDENEIHNLLLCII